ncbi:hypothetical protein [Escherichia coli]|uniref:hypothetical protein n=1 Tax=Escherichia coli TaxID=562 RepID=UPI0013C34A0F|nr:hypothetical protein [Escherichia coli]
MSNNLGTLVHIFTDKTLQERDMEIAIKVTQATATHVVREMNKMSPPQQLRAGTKKGREEMMLSEDVLMNILGTVSK